MYSVEKLSQGLSVFVLLCDKFVKKKYYLSTTVMIIENICWNHRNLHVGKKKQNGKEGYEGNTI